MDVPAKAYIDGTLGVYELNRVELLRDLFVWAYERSCQRYVAIKESPGSRRAKMCGPISETRRAPT